MLFYRPRCVNPTTSPHSFSSATATFQNNEKRDKETLVDRWEKNAKRDSTTRVYYFLTLSSYLMFPV